MTALTHLKACPKPALWLRLVDRQLTEETAAELREHSEDCPTCRERAEQARQLIDRLGEDAPVETEPAELRALIVASARPHAEPGAQSDERGRLFPWWVTVPALACLAVVAVATGLRSDRGAFTSRGGAARHTLARDVGISFYATGPQLRPLRDGDALGADTPIVTSYRNLSAAEAYLRVVAIDASGREQWVQPASADAPPVRLLPAQDTATPLPETVVLETPAPGALKLVSLITREPGESPAGDWTAETLLRRYPSADVQTVELRVVRE